VNEVESYGLRGSDVPTTMEALFLRGGYVFQEGNLHSS
jgi:hypothetical protein